MHIDRSIKARINQFVNRNLIGEKSNPLSFEFSGVMRYIPLIVCGGFFLLTIFIFSFGPLEWHVSNPLKLYSFLFFCCVALVVGYVFAVNNARTPNAKLNLNTNTILIASAAVYLVLYIPTLMATTGKLYPDIVTGIMDTGRAYRITKYYNEYGNQLALYFRILLSPFTIMVTPITLFFMPKLSKIGKLLGWIVIAGVVCLSISQGMNKAVADFTAQIVLFLCMLFFTKSKNGSNTKHRIKIVLSIVLVCGLFFAYYSTGMRNRVAMDQTTSNHPGELSRSPIDIPEMDISEKKIDSSVMSNSTFGFATEKVDYPPFKLLPQKLKPAVTFLSSYLSHGYKGLSIAMEQKFTTTYGLGFSDFFRHNFLKIVGKADQEKEIIKQTYYGKTNRESWQTGSVWSTFFVYPSSDISFFGTIVLVLLIGYLFALSWKDALLTENPFAITSFFCFSTMIFYFSANNQMFQGGENFLGFTSMLILWLFSRSALLKAH